MFSKVLVPVDKDEVELSEGIVPYVSLLSKNLSLSVVFLSVLNPSDFQETENTLSENEVRNRLNHIISSVTEDNAEVQVDVVVGSDPAEVILGFSETKGCDLIAIAAHDRNLIGQAVLGSVTNEVVRSAKVPVLAITTNENDAIPASMATLSKVIVPLDGTAFSEAALPYVEFLAHKMSLEVLLTRTVSTSDAYPGLGGVTPVVSTGVPATELRKMVENEAQEYLHRISQGLKSKGIKVSKEILSGDPSENIADLADVTSNSMIVLVSHGRSGVMRWVLGSVAEDLLRNTGDPVLIIPSQVAEDQEE